MARRCQGDIKNGRPRSVDRVSAMRRYLTVVLLLLLPCLGTVQKLVWFLAPSWNSKARPMSWHAKGWSYIAVWNGVPLSYLLDLVGTRPEAKYVVY